jgi:hypothetical protein
VSDPEFKPHDCQKKKKKIVIKKDSYIKKKSVSEVGVFVHNSNPSTQKDEEFEASMGNKVRLVSKPKPN